MDKLDISEIGMQHKLEEEVARFNKFQRGILGMQGIRTNAKDVDLRTYAKYLLREGSVVEKRELLACVRSRFIFKNKSVALQCKI